MHSFCFNKTTIPGCAGESKKAFAVSFERSGMVYNIKRCSTQREEPRLRGAGQAMQETEYPVPLERLAGRLPFQGLRRPPGKAGGPDSARQLSPKTTPRHPACPFQKGRPSQIRDACRGRRAGARTRRDRPCRPPRCKPVRCRAAGAGPSSVCRTQPRAAFSDDVRLTLRGAGARRVLPEQPPDKDAVLKQRAQHPVYRCKQDEQRAEHTDAQRGKPISMGFEAPYAHTQPVHFPTGPDAEADGHEQADRQRIILCSAAPSLS